MDNGQPVNNQQDFFAGVTAGVGNAASETNPLSPRENLDSSEFETPNRDYGKMGNSVLNAPEMPPKESPEGGRLGQISTLPTPPLVDSVGQPKENISSKSNEEENMIDSASIKRFKDGKVNIGDIAPLEEEIKARVSSPAEVVDFVKAVRHEVLNVEQKAA